MNACNLCHRSLGEPVYVSPGDVSMTSLALPRPGTTRVYFCESCGHTQTEPLPDLDAFYQSEYRILLDSEDEDQLYAIEGERKVFRVEHQVRTLLSQLDLPAGAAVLDFGCAKGATARRLMADRPDLDIHLFDVSTMYGPFWERFAPRQCCAAGRVPPEWAGRFDVVMSFFVMEHVVDPVASLREQARLLRPGGRIYFIVPNMEANPADLIVADHVNHFSAASLYEAMSRAGMDVLSIDANAHQGAWTVTASVEKPSSPPAGRPTRSSIEQNARLWTLLATRVTAFENGVPSAIYGAGFYGSFIASCLRNPHRVRCFVDRNPHLLGRTHMGKPVITPEQLDEDVQSLYVGLSPRVARQAVDQIDAWKHRRLKCFFVGEST